MWNSLATAEQDARPAVPQVTARRICSRHSPNMKHGRLTMLKTNFSIAVAAVFLAVFITTLAIVDSLGF
jgi:hypothetical protein